ncbi:MAG TPA: hypothetical protein GXX36_08260 [Clostridiaceae bacterium]|nr:hypothetical protein [Clostridiaceae bacterium]
MKKIFTLLKINLNLNFGISALKYRFTREKKKRWEPVLVVLGIIAGVCSMTALYSLMMLGVFNTGLALNQPEIVLTVAFLFGQLMVLIFGIFYVMSMLFFANDLNILVPLPLKPYEVLGSKLAVVMVNEYMTLLPVLLPPVIIYGVGMKQHFFYWVKAIALVLVSPVIPLILDAIFLLVIMRFINVRKNKDLFAILGGIIGILFAVGINVITQRMPKGNEEEFIRNLLLGNIELIELIGSKFPPSIWVTRALSQAGISGVLYLLLFIAVSAFMFVVLMWLANRIFYKGLLAGQEVSRKRKKLTTNEADRQFSRVTSPVVTIFWREWKIIVRTPIYLLNGLSGIIVAPMIIVVMLVSQKSGDMKELFELINQPGAQMVLTLIAIGVVLFTAGMNLVASTAVSREGRTFWISKIIPVSPKQQVMGKFLNSFSVALLGVIIMSVVMAILLELPVIRFIVIVVIGAACSVATTALNLLIDVLRPKLVWNNPQEAMKQNMNGLLGMLISFAIMAILTAAAVPMAVAKLPEWIIYGTVLLICVALSVLSLLGLFAVAEKSYHKLEM